MSWGRQRRKKPLLFLSCQASFVQASELFVHGILLSFNKPEDLIEKRNISSENRNFKPYMFPWFHCFAQLGTQTSTTGLHEVCLSFLFCFVCLSCEFDCRNCAMRLTKWKTLHHREKSNVLFYIFSSVFVCHGIVTHFLILFILVVCFSQRLELVIVKLLCAWNSTHTDPWIDIRKRQQIFLFLAAMHHGYETLSELLARYYIQKEINTVIQCQWQRDKNPHGCNLSKFQLSLYINHTWKWTMNQMLHWVPQQLHSSEYINTSQNHSLPEASKKLT